MTRVGVIEDDAAIRQVVRLVLEDAGHEVVEANDGLSGLALLQSSMEPLVAVIDHQLPRLDGSALLDLVATDERLRQRHRFVFITANTSAAVDACGATLEELAVPLLPKPFDIDELVAAVHAAEKRLAARASDRPPDGPG
jgi:two-component system, chemotaxis family, chemotaxis protein CheY